MARDQTAPADLPHAEAPSEFGWSDWKAILLRTKDEIAADNVGLVAAGIAFWALMAFVPAIAAMVGFYGLIADPSDIASHLAALKPLLPSDAFGIIEDQVNSLIDAQPGSLGLASAFGSLLALWSAKSGVRAMIAGLNIVYDERDERGFFAATGTTVALTALLIATVLIAFAAVLVLPAILGYLPLGEAGEWAASIARWPIVAAAVIFAIGALYRWGPHRDNPKVRWVTWGAVVATAIWVLASLLFSVYVANFGSYNETYGSLGAVVVLLMWFYLSAFIVLAGAELDSEMEHHTRADTTTGPARPRGQRGAYVADNLPIGGKEDAERLGNNRRDGD